MNSEDQVQKIQKEIDEIMPTINILINNIRHLEQQNHTTEIATTLDFLDICLNQSLALRLIRRENCTELIKGCVAIFKGTQNNFTASEVGQIQEVVKYEGLSYELLGFNTNYMAKVMFKKDDELKIVRFTDISDALNLNYLKDWSKFCLVTKGRQITLDEVKKKHQSIIRAISRVLPTKKAEELMYEQLCKYSKRRPLTKQKLMLNAKKSKDTEKLCGQLDETIKLLHKYDSIHEDTLLSFERVRNDPIYLQKFLEIKRKQRDRYQAFFISQYNENLKLQESAETKALYKRVMVPAMTKKMITAARTDLLYMSMEPPLPSSPKEDIQEDLSEEFDMVEDVNLSECHSKVNLDEILKSNATLIDNVINNQSNQVKTLETVGEKRSPYISFNEYQQRKKRKLESGTI